MLWLERSDLIRSRIFQLLMSCAGNDSILSDWYSHGEENFLPAALTAALVSGVVQTKMETMVIQDLQSLTGTLFGWLLALKIIRRYCLLHPECQEGLIGWLREHNIHGFVLDECFSWFGVLKGDKTSNRSEMLDNLNVPKGNDFETSSNPIEVARSYSGKENIRALLNCVLVRTLRVLPALARQWWADSLDRSSSALSLSFVAQYVTPVLIKQEVSEIHSAVSAGAFPEDEMQVFASSVSRTVTTLYKKDGCTLEMIISIPESYPFKTVTVECTKQLGVPEKRWRRWVIQIVSLLSTQDGSILDAVNLTKKNLDKEFEGSEPCPICYCVIHVQDHTMPRLECKTCHYKYHSKCVSTWFQKSKKNECPMCKQPWSDN